MPERRVIYHRPGDSGTGPVIYWMQRDQRVSDNHALFYAASLAAGAGKKLRVVFNLVPGFLGATIRQYRFMLKGLREVEENLRDRNIPFDLIMGNPVESLPEYLSGFQPYALVSDFNPLKIARKWKGDVLKQTQTPYYTIDAHNIVPVTAASDKQEFGAYTIRPKINRQLEEFSGLSTGEQFFEKVYSGTLPEKIDWDSIRKKLSVDESVGEISDIAPGEKGAHQHLKNFIENKLSAYGELRNDPNSGMVSGLSPWLHFGHISAQRIHHLVRLADIDPSLTAPFIEELVVRKELSDNFCFYNSNYDSVEGFPDWAKKTINEHRKDEREYLYTANEFEQGKTHDPLWNAAQMEMVLTGRMHGYMRMYWAKKILEWTESAEKAMKTAIYLNDKYQLDGRDPNGYTGIAWSIGGVHDRAWAERPVFGKIRYMNYNGCKRKFDVAAYIKKFGDL